MRPSHKILFLAALMASVFSSCSANTASLKVNYNTKVEGKRVIEVTKIENNTSLKDILSVPFVVMQGDQEIPHQVVFDRALKSSSLLIYPDPANGKEITIRTDIESKTTFPILAHADLWKKVDGQFVDRKYVGGKYVETDSVRLPDESTDHSFYLKFEGPGWESNLVGYRFYLDWRNAVDIFGKQVGDMVLKNVGQDGESYHVLRDWGMDILKVGNSLGLGSIGYWNGKAAERVAKTDSLITKVIDQGPLRASIQTDYYGWQTNDFNTHCTSFISIDGNSRLTKQVLLFDKAPSNICTGIHIDTTCEVIKTSKGNWVALATWGKQSLNNDNLGMVIFADKQSFVEYQKDPDSHIIIMKPENNMVSWLFGACWELEKNGITTLEGFKEYIDQQLELLNNPDKVK